MASDLTKAVLHAIDAGASSEEFAAIDPSPFQYTGVALHADEAETLGKLPRAREAAVAGHARRAGAHARARARRGADRDHGVVDQLQHGLVGDLRARADVRVPVAATERCADLGQAPRPAIPRRRLGRSRRRAAQSGSAVSRWKPGDRVVVHPNDVALEDPQGHDDTIQDPDQRVWGFESNYGGLGEICIAKGDQLMPKAEHLTWEEAASHAARQLHGLPDAGRPERRRHAAGRRRPDLGRRRRAGRLRARSTC